MAGKNIRHDKSDPGDANRGEVGLRYSYNDKKDTAGLSAAFVSADREENEYQEYRGFATYSPAKLRLTLDALTQQYKKEINGKKNQFQVVATAGYQLLAALQLSGNLTYTQSPSFQEDYAGLVRVSYDLGDRAREGRNDAPLVRREHPRGGPARPAVRLLRRLEDSVGSPETPGGSGGRGGSTASSATRTSPRVR